MEAEEVLLLIMNKLKEYKANPKKSAFHEKARQKNLMKMFRIYTSLKKKERAKQKLGDPNHTSSIEASTMSQETNPSFDEIVDTEEPTDHTSNDSINCHETCQIVYDSKDLLSTHDRYLPGFIS